MLRAARAALWRAAWPAVSDIRLTRRGRRAHPWTPDAARPAPTEPIESTFATVRLRTRITKEPGSRARGLAGSRARGLAGSRAAGCG
ncbi:MAG: hypothetical protein FJ035_05800, partial [Chloroflexi bacterium]|nr:hypothetical protein [Chloroflexota bacterium]